MEKLPKDILIKTALEFNMPDIISFCKASSYFNSIVCENNIFWINKLKKDFDVDYLKDYHIKVSNKINPKFYYLELNNLVNRESSEAWLKSGLMHYGLTTNRIDVVKAAVQKGAILTSENPLENPYNIMPVIDGLIQRQYDIVDYLLNNDSIKNKNDLLSIIGAIIRTTKNTYKEDKIKIYKILYDQILPKGIEYIKDEKHFLLTIFKKLEEFGEDPEFKDVYDKRIEFCRKYVN